MSYDRAVLAGAVVREKLRNTTVVRGRGYDVAAHQQAAMPELLLAGQDADPDPLCAFSFMVKPCHRPDLCGCR